MGRVSPRSNELKTPSQKRSSRRQATKYLKPGALAKLRYGKAEGSKFCTALVGLLDIRKTDNGVSLIANEKGIQEDSPSLLSPDRFMLSPVAGSFNLSRHRNLLTTLNTPFQADEVCGSDSRLEALPMDLLVTILCHLHHDQLHVVFHVSQRIRKAAIVARQFHFNYTTPDRPCEERLQSLTPLATEHWPLTSNCNAEASQLPDLRTPKAPRHGPRPPSRLKGTEMRQIAAVLFQEPPFPSRCWVPSVFSKPQCKNRVLLYEEELCQAVTQNKLG